MDSNPRMMLLGSSAMLGVAGAMMVGSTILVALSANCAPLPVSLKHSVTKHLPKQIVLDASGVKRVDNRTASK